MLGLTRGPVTLLAAAAAGLLIWISTQLNNAHEGGYWGIIGLMAGAGLLMALSQILGGWTKWGWPRLSPIVLLVAFVPVAIAALWVIFAAEPNHGWFHDHVMAWTRDIHISGLVTDMLKYIPVLAFGAGLVFGFSFDTTGPRVREAAVDRERTYDRRRRDVVAPADRRDADEPLTAERGATVDDRPRRSRFFGRTRDREREPVASDGRPVDERNGRYVDEADSRYSDKTDRRYADETDGRYADEADGRNAEEPAPTRTTERS
jgi:hypothetical protein